MMQVAESLCDLIPWHRRWLTVAQFAVGCVATVVAWGHTAHAEDLADLAERCEKSVVRIDMEDGLGSGFIIDASGTFVTNFHVLAGTSRAKATFADGREVDILGTLYMDKKRDIVIAKLDADGLPSLPIATSMPRKGESVIALGCPHGLNFSLTQGIVSAIRDAATIDEDGGLQGQWLQHDAAISPGNSGGPLINRNGEVVGVNTLASASAAAQNINFGISCLDVADALSKARYARLTALRDGAAKESVGSHRHSGGGDLPSVPTAAVRSYVERTRGEMAFLARDLREQLNEESKRLKELKSGEIYANFDGERGRIVFGSSNRYKVIFRSEEIKARHVRDQEGRLRRLQALGIHVRNLQSDAAVEAFARDFGPRLNTREKGSIGFLNKARVVAVVNEDIVLADIDGQPYALGLLSTTGLFDGNTLMPKLFYVAENRVLEADGQSLNLTLLVEVAADRISDAFDKPNPAAADTPQTGSLAEKGSSFSDLLGDSAASRLWMTKDGRFSITASFVEYNQPTGQVKLKKLDKSVIEVPLALLSDSDQRFVLQMR